MEVAAREHLSALTAGAHTAEMGKAFAGAVVVPDGAAVVGAGAGNSTAFVAAATVQTCSAVGLSCFPGESRAQLRTPTRCLSSAPTMGSGWVAMIIASHAHTVPHHVRRRAVRASIGGWRRQREANHLRGVPSRLLGCVLKELAGIVAD